MGGRRIYGQRAAAPNAYSVHNSYSGRPGEASQYRTHHYRDLQCWRYRLRLRLACFISGMILATLPPIHAQSERMSVPKTVQAGNAFSIQSSGSGKAVLYIVGPAQVIKQDVELGKAAYFPADSLYNAGRYQAILVTDSSKDNVWFNVVPASKPANLSFLARPSRISIGLHNGISGTLYIFDAYHNLI